MKARTKARIGGLGALFAVVVAAQSGSNLPQPPSGFTLSKDGGVYAMYRSSGAGDGWAAEKKNDLPAVCFSTVPKKASLSIGWMKATPYQATYLAQLAKQPEEPAHDAGGYFGTHDAPDGKSQFKGGVLTWRKLTWRSGEVMDDRNHCPGKTVVTYNATWQGYASSKSLTVTLTDYYGDKSAAEGALNQAIDGLIAAAGGK